MIPKILRLRRFETNGGLLVISRTDTMILYQTIDKLWHMYFKDHRK